MSVGGGVSAHYLDVIVYFIIFYFFGYLSIFWLFLYIFFDYYRSNENLLLGQRILDTEIRNVRSKWIGKQKPSETPPITDDIEEPSVVVNEEEDDDDVDDE